MPFTQLLGFATLAVLIAGAILKSIRPVVLWLAHEAVLIQEGLAELRPPHKPLEKTEAEPRKMWSAGGGK